MDSEYLGNKYRTTLTFVKSIWSSQILNKLFTYGIHDLKLESLLINWKQFVAIAGRGEHSNKIKNYLSSENTLSMVYHKDLFLIQYYIYTHTPSPAINIDTRY